MKVIIHTIFISVLLLIMACKKQMANTSKISDLLEFDTLQLQSVFEVFLIQGTENNIKIEGAGKIIDAVDFKIINNTLTIKNDFKHNWLYPKNNKVKLYITVNQISKIIATETCDIKSLNALTGNEIGLLMASKYNAADLELACNTFYYWNNFPCGGQIRLKGKVNELKIWNVALMAIDAQALTTNFALVTNASKGDIKVNCTQKLTYKITGSGNIFLKGNPSQIDKIEESASGRLIIE